MPLGGHDSPRRMGMRANEQVTDLMCHDMTENPSLVPVALFMELTYGAVEHVAISACPICCKERNAEDVLILPLGAGHDTEIQVVWSTEGVATRISGRPILRCAAVSPLNFNVRGLKNPACLQFGPHQDISRDPGIIEDINSHS